MKKHIFLPLILFSFLALFFFAQPVAALTPVEKDIKSVKVGVYDNYPKIYRDEEGKIQGFWADITNHIAEKENWKLEYVFDSWDANIKKLEQGKIDMMVDVAVSEDRAEKFDFNKEVGLVSWGIFYARNGVSVESFSDLEGKKIAIMKSGILYDGPFGLKSILASFEIEAEIVDVSVYADVFKLLDSGEADVGVVNWFFGIANQDKYKVYPTEIIFNPSELKYAFPKGAAKNEYLISVIDYELKDLKTQKDSVYQQSLKRNFGYFTAKEEVNPKWLDNFLIGTGILAVIAVLGFVLMKRYQQQLAKEIKEKVRELDKSNVRYKDLYQSLHDAVVTMTVPTCQITSGNIAALKMFLVKDDAEFTSRSIFEYSPEKQPDGQLSADKARQIIQKVNELGTYTFEWKHKRTDGSEFLTSVFISRVEVDGDAYMQATIRDITAEKASEARLAELDSCRKKFIQAVSNQVKTPLTAMRWSLESLSESGRNELAPDQMEIIKKVMEQQNEIIKRIDDMSELLDIEEGRVILSKSEFALDSLLKSVLTNFETFAKTKQIILNVEVDSQNTYKIIADVQKIRVVMEHLVDNAISYTPNQGSVNIKLTRNNGNLRFEVTDTGIGIPQIEQAQIFTTFFRGSNATSQKPDDSGLGLKISKAYIEQHGGKLGFISTEGKGSSFWFEVPITGEVNLQNP